jgi:hypothetical protein
MKLAWLVTAAIYLEIILGAYESARQGRMLEFPIVQEDFPLNL